MTKILFLEDHASVRQSVASMLEKLDSSLQIIQAGNMQDALNALHETPQIQTVIIDLSLAQSGEAASDMGGGGTNDGVFALSELRKIVPELNAIVYTMFSDTEQIRRCIVAKAQGYVTKSSSVEELLCGIKAVASGGSYFCREAMEVLSKATRLSEQNSYKQDIFSIYRKLTPKEKEIFILCAKGHPTERIAKITGKKESTIKNQRTSIYQKLGCSDRYELSQMAKELGII